MNSKLIRRIVRGAAAVMLLGVAAYEYTHAGFTTTAALAGVAGIMLGWMAATGQG